MKKIWTGINLFAFVFTMTYCSTSPHGLYSHCWGENPKHKGCHYLDLRSDHTFTYSDPFNISGNLETEGTWQYSNNKLTLNYRGRNRLDSNKSEHGYPLIETVRLQDEKIWVHYDTLTKRTLNKN